ncbi:hypothetical protein NK211_13085 [Mammaliicoccus sciuri]|uniref:hypothetical protein n=1 Tax=Mammaliicoccus sciuri TaxID=1296 RepID=UPI00209D7FB4|nr:hypothetical protein [Mammaliicoccus sciuri]MCP1288313.1 hypothetical protein [Mammaliicoccus sciuri]
MTYKYEGKFISLLDRLDEEERDFIFRGIDDELKDVYAKAKAFDRIKIISNKYANDLSTSAEQCVDLIEDELEDRNAI